ncbi:MAG: capsule assembly Wzi family protein [Longimicrobiales bacterium]|nr:capsule assembly Wzi family protein [Longimicrobiales bacterium]
MLLGNLSVEVGRNHAPHGHAREYGPVMSHNPRGLDMIRLSMERPGRFPWIFRHLGPVGVSAYVADMGRDQDIPGSKLFVFEGAIRPHRNLELGGALLNHQLGEGAPDAEWHQRVRDILFIVHRRPFYIFPPVGGEFSDKVMAADARLTLPGQGIELYAEVASTDDHGMFDAAYEALWTEAAWTWGVRASGLGDEGRLDLWAEAGRNGVRPYTHHQFTSGMTVDRRVIGSPLGPLGTGFQGGVDWTDGSQTISWNAAWERYSGDNYGDGVDKSYLDWVRLADNPDEVRIRTTLDWTRQAALSGLRTTVRLGYEHVTRFDFTDRNRSNFLAQVGVGYVW